MPPFLGAPAQVSTSFRGQEQQLHDWVLAFGVAIMSVSSSPMKWTSGRVGRGLGALTALLLMLGPSAAADPTGEWLVADGAARIKIDSCNSRMWGVIAWEKQPGGVDQNNPDPAKRTRTTLGMPILLGMEQTAANRWDGEIYNPQNGKTYTANISLESADALRVQGCVLGFLCGGQTWTRAQPEPTASAKPGGAAKKPATPPRTAASAGQAKPSDVCAAVTATTGVTSR
jgi:uncharacterized protein (DUF2147 family)